MDCGPSCLRMIARHYGKSLSLSSLREKALINREGVSLLGLSSAAEAAGMRSLAIQTSYESLRKAPLPCIAHWERNHFVVVYKAAKRKVIVGDPAQGVITYSKSDFLAGWAGHAGREGICLLLEPASDFHWAEEEKPEKTSFKFLLSYLRPHKRFFFQLLLGLLFGSGLQLIAPLLTQTLVDTGINNRDLGLIYIILLAQFIIFASRLAVDLIRSWVLLHVSTRINVSIISDFLVKLMKLPMPFFDTRHLGDILQRIGDHRRIENFLSVTTLSVIFSLVNFAVFGAVMISYSLKVFIAFLTASAASAFWIKVFLKKRRGIDSKRFDQEAQNQNQLIQLISGMQAIKLSGAEKQKRWEWEKIQAKLFKTHAASLSLEQYQQIGAQFINQIKSLMIALIAAIEVIEGRMTLGMMMAISSILGQLDGAIEQLIGFVRSAQDARLSLERLSEIHTSEEEDEDEKTAIVDFRRGKDILFEEVSFAYPGPDPEPVLSDVTIQIPHGKVTAIVGASGSGKTTLLKLLLKFYEPVRGEIKLGDLSLSGLNSRSWRQRCGAVMQDGFIFSDSIANNIALGDEAIDRERLCDAARIANIHEFIESLPLSYKTKIGPEGQGLSQGQRQRILIARAVYQDPEYLFFDEATSALDARNERIILENLHRFFEQRTVVVIAHRLSTVRGADQIVVLDQGRVAERGPHEELARQRGIYFYLVKNQLELGT